MTSTSAGAWSSQRVSSAMRCSVCGDAQDAAGGLNLAGSGSAGNPLCPRSCMSASGQMQTGPCGSVIAVGWARAKDSVVLSRSAGWSSHSTRLLTGPKMSSRSIFMP